MTYRILVVDDDDTIRQGLVHTICGELGEGADIFQAANGLEALELVCAESIDLLVTDIKIPLCNGIELIRKLKEMGYRGEIVVVSGFDDYAFVRDAMKLGTADYILKPVVAEDFLVLVKSCLQRIDLAGKDRAFYDADGHKHRDRALLEQQYQFKQLLQGDWKLEIAGRPISPDEKVCMLAVDLHGRGRQLGEHEKRGLFLTMEGIVAEALDRRTCHVVQGEAGVLWGVALIGREEVESGFKKVVELVEKMNWRHGASGGSQVVEKAADAWQKAVCALEEQFYDIPASGGASIEKEKYPFEALRHQVLCAVREGDSARFTALFQQLFGCLCHQKLPVTQLRQYLVNMVYALMSLDNEFIGILGRYKFTGHDVVLNIQDAVSASRMRQRVTDSIALYMEEKQRAQSREEGESQEDYTVRRVKKMIDENYQSEISLAAISEKLDLHPNYVSTMFRQKTGMTYGQYLRSLRIRRAKEMMRDTNLKLYAIAEAVGYNDNAHFYRAFKEEAGISPAQYKKQLRFS